MNIKETNVRQIPVVGYGAIGREVTRLLLARGYNVRVIQRNEPAKLPDGASFFKADAMNAEQLANAIDGATTVVFALGLPYSGKVWEEGWPRAMRAILAACDKVDARMVYADSLYLYGPQNHALHEALPPVKYGRKPTARSTATRLWQEAFADGRVKTAAVRAPDFSARASKLLSLERQHSVDWPKANLHKS